jgi:glycosyltransferase involved in cell wall biosynthesis
MSYDIYPALMEPLLLDCTAFHPSHSSGGVSVYMQEILGSITEGPRFKAFYKNIEPRILDSCGPLVTSQSQVRGNMLVWRDRAVRRFAKEGAKGVWFPTQFSAWRPALPSLVTVHDMAAYLAWRSLGAVAKLYMPATLLSSSLNARKILVVSEASANDLHRLFPWTRKRTVVARHGLPSDVREKAIAVGVEKHRGEGPLLCIFLDGANPRKRLDLCLEAFERRGWLGIELCITGSPQKVAERVTRVLGRVPSEIHLPGRLERQILLDTLAASDILIYPSDFEGFGFPLIEAMAFGTSVVSFPGNAEREVGGDYAVYAATLDAAGLRAAVDVAAERCRDRAWQRSLIAHALSFHWEESIRVHRDAFAELAS